MPKPYNNPPTNQCQISFLITFMAHHHQRLLFLLSFSLLFSTCPAVDFISANSNLKDGATIISAAGNFELGFFTPAGSSNRYLAIWYKKISACTTVWIANRDFPVGDSTGLLRLNPDGTLILLSSSNSKIWSSNSSGSVRNPVAQLLDTGNFVVRDENDETPEKYLWQSFDYPGDTALPGMKFGKDLVNGLDRRLTPWKSSNDPSPGNFTALIDTIGYPQFVMKMGSVIQYRPGPWNGVRFSGQPNMKPDNLYTFKFVMNEKEIYYEYDLVDKSFFMRNVINPLGNIELSYWIDRTKSWSTYITTNTDSCDRYGLCGPHGSCDVNSSPACNCLDKFEPSAPQQWGVADWSGGCKRKTPLDCGTGEGFIKYTGLKLPDTESSWSDKNMNIDECKKRCKSNCNCTAYTNLDIRGSGSGCLQWFGNLIDIRTYTNNGQDIYIRMAASELPPEVKSSSGNKQMTTIIVAVLSVLPVIVLGLGLLYIFKRRRKRREEEEGPMDQNFAQELRQEYSIQSQREDLELPFFTLPMLLKATSNFSINNKLGEGGFGAVYKGELKGGQIIAVKRLSESSTQGIDEFKNEVVYVSKLQHRNLVKLLGCCIEGKEKMLVYEYMPNKGLDSFIFDKSQSTLLDWPKRFHIINGIARGLLYLHQDSRLRIIHRDLKASNILLDSDMTPKISDFGVARSFGEDVSEANTRRVVGTYGYMAPEYAGDGLFSIKSDVFSYGVLLLEMISGKKNRGFFHQDHNHNLLGHAWRLHKEGRSLELVDKSLDYSGHEPEVETCIRVGLLCVQHSPEDRPTMPNVVLMLSCKGGLPRPKQPGFFTHRTTPKTIPESESSSSTYPQNSTSEVTMTFLDGR